MPATKVSTDDTSIPLGDYVSEGLAIVLPDSCFPNMIIGDKASHPWPYLRREINHNWYCDRRAPMVGFLNRDEAILLHNLALQFRGKPGLEIGSWMGWSTCHLALAGLALDVIDPILANAENLSSIRDSLTAAGVLGNVQLYASGSPAGVRELAKLHGTKWNFFFIDGNHEGPAPARDAAECLEHAAEDAMMVFHDLTSPDVEEGLKFLWRRGWQVLIYQTMQIVGVAWRGTAKPVSHKPDPSIAWTLPPHLVKYQVSGATPSEELRRLSHGMAWRDQEFAQLLEESESLRAQVDGLDSAVAARDSEIIALRSDLESRNSEMSRLRTLLADQTPESAELREIATELSQVNFALADRRAEVARLEIEVVKRGALLNDAAVEFDRLSVVLAARDADLKTRNSDMSQLQEQIASLKNQLSTSSAEFERANALLVGGHENPAQLREQIEEQDNQIRHLLSEVGRFSRQNSSVSSEIKDLQWAFHAVTGSISWSITQPLRRAKSSRLALKMNEVLMGLPRRTLEYLRRERLADAALEGERREKMALLFDAAFYCEMNPDVAEAGVDPFLHYLSHGASEGRDPHPLFDTSFYCEMNPHVIQTKINPLLHFVSRGVDEDRDPHPLFNVWFYRHSNPDVVQAGINPLVHYMTFGAKEGRNPHPLFDTAFYCERNADVVQAGMNPLVHYVMYGGVEGRDPHPLFDTAFYFQMNPDLAQGKINPLLHYLTNGAKEGRNPHPLFDTSFHISQNPDVAQAGINPLLHYAIYGLTEDRDPHPMFDTSFYREQKPQVQTLGINPLVHFLKEGATMEFDPLTPTPELPDAGICIVTPDVVGPVKNGGIGTACYHFARVLADAGHPTSIFFTGDLTDCQKAHWRNTYAKSKIKFIALSDAPPVTHLVYGTTWFYERSWRVFEYLRKSRYSVVHFQDWQANGFWSIKAKQVGLAFRQTQLTVMTHSCTTWINEGMQQFAVEPLETAKLVWAETYCVERCDALLSPSRYMMDWAREKGIALPPKTYLTPYAWSHTDKAETLNAPIDNDHLIFFGRLETRKGLHVFCDALRQLQLGGVGVPQRVSFLGKHASVLGLPSANYLEALKRDLPMIEFRIINDFDYLQALTYIRKTRGLVVICPIMDNYPLTVIECIESRLPFLASTTGGIPEMIDDRISFKPTVSSLTTCLKTRAEISHADIQHKYSPKLAATLWHELHAELISELKHDSGSGTLQAASRRGVQKVSVCIPYFNHTQYLENLVMEFARQGYPSLEVILVNDGSSNPQATEEFHRVTRNNRDGRFKFVTTENQGPGAARNYAAESSTGELLLFFDADNVPKNASFVSTLVSAIQCSGADCVTSPYDIVGAEKILVRDQDTIATYRPVGPCLEAGFFENVLGDATMIIKRSAFERLGGFPIRRAAWEDHEFLLSLCFLGLKLETFPDAGFFYRQSPNGRNQQANAFQNYQSLFERLKSAPSKDLARIITAVGAPMLHGRPGSSHHGVAAR